MEKHAFLIIAHDNYDQLQFLVSLLDHPLNDIYIHIDKKSKQSCMVKTVKSRLFIISGKEAIDVRWGDVSLVQCEMLLFEWSFKSGEIYSYYHLLSGYCLPIKTMEYIHSFFKENKGKNFIGFGNYGEETFVDRIAKRHYFTRKYKVKPEIINKFYKLLRLLVEIVSNTVFPSKRKSSLIYKKGAEWCSLSHEFVEYMVANKKFILSYYKNSCCADEIYKQTLIWNSPFKDTIYDNSNEFYGCLRLIDWKRGNPYVWGGDDKDYVIIDNTPCLFARKFDIRKYPHIVKYIENLVL